MRKMVVFAGAGASRAVNESYPTTADFFARLPKEIIGEVAIQNVLGHLGGGQKDVEELLEHLDYTIEYLQATQRGAGSGSARDSYLESLWQGSLKGGLPEGLKVLRSARIAQQELQKLVHKFYGTRPSAKDLADNWHYLFERVTNLSGGLRVDVFTTNYDIVVETALQNFPHLLETGFIPDAGYSLLSLSHWQNAPHDSGALTKLHGSIHWKHQDNDILVGHAHPSESLDDHVIIYPGFKGTPDYEPFETFHSYFDKRLREANYLVFVGFAFRDEAINSVIQNAERGARIVIIDKEPREEWPALFGERSDIRIIDRGFDSQAVSQALGYFDLKS